MDTTPKANVLVLLIGEVLEDPRVYKTCTSLRAAGADVSVACTTLSRTTPRETHAGLDIIRFPHPKEFVVKRLYNGLQGFLKPGVSRAVSQIHEEVPKSSVKALLRNTVLSMNFRHSLRGAQNVNRQMVKMFDRGKGKNSTAGLSHDGPVFDLAHCNDIETLTAGVALKKNGVARKLLYDTHEFWPGIGVHGSAPNAALRALEASLIDQADYVVTVNSMIADLMRSEYGLAQTPTAVMNCPPRFEGAVATDDVHEPVRVLYQGKVQAYRGLESLVLAFRHIEGAVLTISGWGPLTDRLKRLISSEGLDAKITMTGKYLPENTMDIVTRHDIGVLPFDPVTISIQYSSPNKLFDYCMGGLAVAANDLPFLKRFVGDHEIGSVFTSNEPEIIAESLNAMIADTGKLVKYKKKARSVAMEQYFWDRQFENYPFIIGDK